MRSRWIGAAVLLGLALGMFGDVLFTSRPVVLSDGGNDLASQFIYWRAFAADQLRHGHLPLWNPHVFCGMPYLGWAQTAVFYPTNWLDLVLPLPCSINLGIVLHVFLAGLFAYLWGLHRGLHPVAAVVAGALFMFSGSYFLHVYAGHLSLLYAIAWTPLVFASVEEWTQTRKPAWALAGMTAITMQIFAGDFQACFYTAVAAGLFMLFGLIDSRQRTKTLLGFCGMYAGAGALGAVQLLTSLQAVSNSIRAGGVTYGFASMVSFAPENLLTLLASGFFGNESNLPYWGRWYWWEMCLFIGVSGLMLAIYGAIRGRRELRRGLIPLLLITLVLALGANTPLFKFLYRWVPGFDRFRANAKFIIEASLFLVMLAGAGLDQLLRDPKGNKWLALGLFVAGIIVVCAGLGLRSAALVPEPSNWWSRTMQAVHATEESYLPSASYADPSFVRQAGEFASRCLFVAAAELLVLSGLLLSAGASRWGVYAVAFMAVTEVFVFARTSVTTFDATFVEAPKLKAFLDQHPGDYRIFYQRIPNIAIWLGKEDVWGYAPLTLKRYTQFMAFTQGQPPEGADQYVEFTRFHPLYTMLRWRYAFLANKDGDRVLTGNATMPHLQLVQQYRVMSGRDEILQAMFSPSFDPRQQVVLETEPNPVPQPSADKGTVTLVDSSANQLTVEADLPRPAILLITDAYSNGWRARPFADSVQNTYDVLPANYVLRAIPLSQGHHHILIEYAPIGFRVGTWISILSLVGFIFGSALYVRKRRLQPRSVLAP
jgi:hypothetical protein